MSRHRPIGKDMVGALGKVVETTEPLEAGESYTIPLIKGELVCRVIEVQPSLFGDQGSAILEPVFGIVPRSQDELFRIIDELKQTGWK